MKNITAIFINPILLDKHVKLELEFWENCNTKFILRKIITLNLKGWQIDYSFTVTQRLFVPTKLDRRWPKNRVAEDIKTVHLGREEGLE